PRREELVRMMLPLELRLSHLVDPRHPHVHPVIRLEGKGVRERSALPRLPERYLKGRDHPQPPALVRRGNLHKAPREPDLAPVLHLIADPCGHIQLLCTYRGTNRNPSDS